MATSFRILISFHLFLLFLSVGTSHAQVKTSTADAKTLKKAVYGGSYSLANGNIGIFFQEKDELVAYEFNHQAQFVATHIGPDAGSMLSKANHRESTVATQPDISEIKPGMGLKVLYTKESWGSLKLSNGLIYLSSTDKFINGFELEVKDTRKLKIEDAWRTTNIGARAIIPGDKMHYLFKARNGRSMSFDFTKTTTPPIVPHGGYLQAAGVITEKISIRNPSPHNATRR